MHWHSLAQAQYCAGTVLRRHSLAKAKSCTGKVLHRHSLKLAQSCTATVLRRHSLAQAQSCTDTVLHRHSLEQVFYDFITLSGGAKIFSEGGDFPAATDLLSMDNKLDSNSVK